MTQPDYSHLAPALRDKLTPPDTARVNKAPEKIENIKPILADVMRAELARTGFARERVEAFVPQDLKLAFRHAISPGGRLTNDAAGQALIGFLRDEFFKIMPDYNTKASPEQATGYFVRDREIVIYMPRELAKGQIERARRNISSDALLKKSIEVAKDIYTPQEVTNAVLTSALKSPNRRLVAIVLKVAEGLKQGPA